MDDTTRSLLDAAAQPFRRAGIWTWQHARGKLRFDPVYFSLLRRGLLPNDGTLLDLGCGQGILLALIAAAGRQFRCGNWPAGWHAPPAGLPPRRHQNANRMTPAIGTDHRSPASFRFSRPVPARPSIPDRSV